jgi:hypothetical protein
VNIVRPFLFPIQYSLPVAELFDIRCFRPSLPAFTRPVKAANDFFYRLSNAIVENFYLASPLP